MSIEITHVRYGSTPPSEEVIVRYKWRNQQTGQIGENDKPSMVAWIDGGGVAWVGSNPAAQAVTVHPGGGRNPYVRTVADGKYTNNLTNLPTF